MAAVKRRRRAAVAVGALVTAGLVSALVALFVLEGVAERDGHSLDPTDPINFTSFSLRNDGPITMLVRLCDDRACARLDGHLEWVPVAPGRAQQIQVYHDPGAKAVYAVTSSPEDVNTRRCLVLDASSRTAISVDVPLGNADTCAI